MKNVFTYSGLAIIIAGFLLVISCNSERTEEGISSSAIKEKSEKTTDGGTEVFTTTAYAGQTIDVGTITASKDEEYLYVNYTLKDDWYLSETHLWIGDCGTLPVNSQGNPVIGSFPYQTTHDGDLTTYTYQIPLSDLSAYSSYCICAHAIVVKKVDGNVVQKETMFGYGTDFEGKRWGWYFNL